MKQKLLIGLVMGVLFLVASGFAMYIVLSQQNMLPLQNQIQNLGENQNPISNQNVEPSINPNGNNVVPPQPVSPQPQPLNNSSNTLSASFTVYFVDRTTGRKEPIAGFPILGAAFGPSCNEYTLGPGESAPLELGAFCTWRTKLAKEKMDLVTDGNGRATIQVVMPATLGIQRDVLAGYDIYGDPVQPAFGYYASAKQAGWDYQKFSIKVAPHQLSRTSWDVDVTLTGFVGDRP